MEIHIVLQLPINITLQHKIHIIQINNTEILKSKQIYCSNNIQKDITKEGWEIFSLVRRKIIKILVVVFLLKNV